VASLAFRMTSSTRPYAVIGAVFNETEVRRRIAEPEIGLEAWSKIIEESLEERCAFDADFTT
jgi:hypothetical protein